MDQSPSLLTINSGSSSLKFALFTIHRPEALHCRYRGEFISIGRTALFHIHDANGHLFHTEKISISNHEHALKILLDWLAKESLAQKLVGVGHRVVHGGCRFHAPVRVTEDNLTYLSSLIPLAPNHQPACLQGITILQELQPRLPQVACFDTAFHHDRPEVERDFALPSMPELDNVRRYGFHGLSYEYITKILPNHLGELADGKVIIAHLGHGASLCAINQRRSVATTMTFTPLDGIPMGTRCGSIDPAVVLYLQDQGMTTEAISNLLYFQSGLLGVSGETDNMAELLTNPSIQAQRAIEQFVHYTVRAIGSLAAALGGVDALVFTAGIGENATSIRAAISERCKWLGLKLDSKANTQGRACIHAAGSLVQAWVIPTNEAQVVAEQTLHLINKYNQRVSS